jgi:hypothetical protein
MYNKKPGSIPGFYKKLPVNSALVKELFTGFDFKYV